jgi:hypothetical protein
VRVYHVRPPVYILLRSGPHGLTPRKGNSMDKEAMRLRNAALHRLHVISKAREELAQIEIAYEQLTDLSLLTRDRRQLEPLHRDLPESQTP